MHLAGARSLPFDELATGLDELSAATRGVAACRGPYCGHAVLAVRTLRAHGRRPVRFEAGVAEWALDGRPVVRGAA